jgi:GTPase SAR1 family protein
VKAAGLARHRRDGFIFVFDVLALATLKSFHSFAQSLTRTQAPASNAKIPILIVGNKYDNEKRLSHTLVNQKKMFSMLDKIVA